MGLSALEAVGSGFEGIFSRRGLTSGQKERVQSLLERFIPHLASTRAGQSQPTGLNGMANRLFAHFTSPQQALLLFLRAIVNRPLVLILDEPSQGMDEVIWARCRELLEVEWKENPEQAVVIVSHYDDEVSSLSFLNIHLCGIGPMEERKRKGDEACQWGGEYRIESRQLDILPDLRINSLDAVQDHRL